jgi:hypothetical protein
MGGAPMMAEPSVTIWEIVVQVLPPATIERLASGARTALSVMTNASKIAASFIGNEDVGA